MSVADVFDSVFHLTGYDNQTIKRLIETPDGSPQSEYIERALLECEEFDMPRSRVLAQWFNILVDIDKLRLDKGLGGMSSRFSQEYETCRNGDIVYLTDTSHGKVDEDKAWFTYVDISSEKGNITSEVDINCWSTLYQGGGITFNAFLDSNYKTRDTVKGGFKEYCKANNVGGTPTSGIAVLMRVYQFAKLYSNAKIRVIFESSTDFFMKSDNRVAIELFSTYFEPVRVAVVRGTDYNKATVLGEDRLFTVWDNYSGAEDTQKAKENLAWYCPHYFADKSSQHRELASQFESVLNTHVGGVLRYKDKYKQAVESVRTYLHAIGEYNGDIDKTYISFEGRSVLDSLESGDGLEVSLNMLHNHILDQFVGLTTWQ